MLHIHSLTRGLGFEFFAYFIVRNEVILWKIIKCFFNSWSPMGPPHLQEQCCMSSLNDSMWYFMVYFRLHLLPLNFFFFTWLWFTAGLWILTVLYYLCFIPLLYNLTDQKNCFKFKAMICLIQYAMIGCWGLECQTPFA